MIPSAGREPFASLRHVVQLRKHGLHAFDQRPEQPIHHHARRRSLRQPTQRWNPVLRIRYPRRKPFLDARDQRPISIRRSSEQWCGQAGSHVLFNPSRQPPLDKRRQSIRRRISARPSGSLWWWDVRKYPVCARNRPPVRRWSFWEAGRRCGGWWPESIRAACRFSTCSVLKPLRLGGPCVWNAPRCDGQHHYPFDCPPHWWLTELTDCTTVLDASRPSDSCEAHVWRCYFHDACWSPCYVVPRWSSG
ncbi:hypothetical protein IMZ48_27395 [Candidatus Bathyarchaeota archaeon]|nr:hypothetical protein [Candidatus Bathyarchaeota archaeon]